MSTSYKLHRFARYIGDAEAAARGPGPLAKRIARRAVFVAVIGVIGGILRKVIR